MSEVTSEPEERRKVIARALARHMLKRRGEAITHDSIEREAVRLVVGVHVQTEDDDRALTARLASDDGPVAASSEPCRQSCLPRLMAKNSRRRRQRSRRAAAASQSSGRARRLRISDATFRENLGFAG